MADDPFEQIAAQLDVAASDPELDPAERAAKLRDLRARAADLLSAAGRYQAQQEKAREAGAAGLAREVLWARENADVREALLAAGDASEAELDEAGMLSHGELDRLAEEGLLEEACRRMAAGWDRS